MWRSITGSEADIIQAEYDVGQDLARQVRRQLQLDQQPRTGEMLSEIGPRLAACVANKLRRFSFEVVKGEEPNAFALPGGFVFVTRSLLQLCQWDKDEVAFILGHEMGHVIRGHAIDRIISNTAIAAVSRASPARGALAGWLRRVGVEFLESAYSQDLESQADKLGVRLAAAARYDPQGALRLLSRLAKVSQPPNQSVLGEYFSSHPSCKLRIQNLKCFMEENNYR